jgi:tetratricopeptide (TPR) repeat protein
LSIPGVLIFYLRLLVWPVGLSPFYDAGYVTSPGLVSFLLPVAGLLLLSGLLVYIGRANARAGLASLLLVLPLLPLLNLTVFAENEYAHDRYLVLPSIGLSLLAGIGVAAVRRRAPGRSALIQIALAGGVCALLATASASQSVYWSSNLALYRRAVSVSPNNDTAQNNLASELLDQGEIDQAIAIYERIVRRNPRYWRASYNLGYAFYKGGMLDEADFHLSRAIELDSGDADEFLYLGLVAMKKGQLDRATSLVQRAIELKGDGRGYHFALGVLMKKRGDIAAAAEQFRQELAKHPDQHAAVLQLAQIESGR